MNRTLNAIIAILLAFILLLGVNILASALLRNSKIDLTENNLYTLSEGTRNIVKSVKEPVTLSFYFSRKSAEKYMPSAKTYGDRVLELLEEYHRLNPDNIKLEVIDPEPFSEEEDAATMAGLQGVPVSSGGESFFFGLHVKNSMDDEDVLPYLPNIKEEFLEYEITRMVSNMSTPEKLVVGVLSSLDVKGGPQYNIPGRPPNRSQPWAVMQYLRKLYEVRDVDKNAAKIDDDVKVLLIIHPKNLSDDTLYAIDQFVLKGGRAIVLVDPHCLEDKPPPDPKNQYAAMFADRSSNLDKLFKKWGVEMVSIKDEVTKKKEIAIAADRKNALTVSYSRKGKKYEPVDFVAYFQLEKTPEEQLDEDGKTAVEYFDKEDIATIGLKSMRFGFAGAIEAREGAGSSFHPLVRTSKDSMLLKPDSVKFMPDPKKLLEDFKPSGESYVLAAYITGKAESAFPDGNPAKDKKDKSAENSGDNGNDDSGLKKSKSDIHVVVVSDVDFITDRFAIEALRGPMGMTFMNKTGNNLDFLMNLIEKLSGNDDLIRVRARGKFHRQFTRVEKMNKEAKKKWMDKEKDLQKKLDETNKELEELQKKKNKDSLMLLSDEQRKKIEAFNKNKAKIRKQLREIMHEKTREQERLGAWLKFINIGLVPVITGLLAVTLAAIRWYRRRWHHATHSGQTANIL